MIYEIIWQIKKREAKHIFALSVTRIRFTRQTARILVRDVWVRFDPPHHPLREETMKPKLTDADWKAALWKWRPKKTDHLRSAHDDVCKICRKISRELGDEILDYFPGHACKELKCPLAGKGLGVNVCCSGRWLKWSIFPSKETAAAVHAFIAKKYKEWKAKQRGKDR
jgi:hypothetical protein